LPREVVDVPSLEVFKIGLGGALSNPVEAMLKMFLSMESGVGLDGL